MKKMSLKMWHKAMSQEAHYKAFDELVEYIIYMNRNEGLALSKLALDAEVSVQTLYNWIDCRVMFPHFKTIAKVANGLGLDVYYADRATNTGLHELMAMRKAA